MAASHPLIVIYNPVCGDRTGKLFFEEQILPFLAAQGHEPELVVETTHEGHAGKAASTFVRDHSSEVVSIVLGSGDGTLHEVVNEIYSGAVLQNARILIALVPCGTANALYSSLFPPTSPPEKGEGAAVDYKMQSVKALVKGKGALVPLSLAVTQLTSSDSALQEGEGRPLLSAVVTSTALHAAILDTSEALREEHPGLERFKIAAEQNSRKWFKARARLLPIPDRQSPEVYDAETNSFAPACEPGSLELEGPFAYFLSTVNVDRLEPTFIITPLSRTLPPSPGTCDVVVIRPLRDPTVKEDCLEAREGFVPQTWAALMGAYQDGAHVKLRYGDESQGKEDPRAGGNGTSIVEYYRCGGWEWHPDAEDNDAHLLCTDGAISRIGTKGWAECRVSTMAKDRPLFEVYVA